MADPKQDEGFKVVDRRLFTEEGQLRKDAAEQDRRWDEDSGRRRLLRPCAEPSGSAPATGNPARADAQSRTTADETMAGPKRTSRRKLSDARGFSDAQCRGDAGRNGRPAHWASVS